MNKYQSQINKAKSINVLNKIASHIGVKLGNIKDIVKAKNKLTKALEKEQVKVKRDYNKIISKRQENKFKELKPFNRIRNKLDAVHNVNTYLNKSNGEFQSLAELNQLMFEFKNIKGDIKMKHVKQVAKANGYTPNELLNIMNDKIAKFDLNTYRGLLEFYGFKDKEIDELVNDFNNANYKRQDYMLNIINDYAKGKNRYGADDDIEHELAKSNFKGHFDLIIKGGMGWHNEKIDAI